MEIKIESGLFKEGINRILSVVDKRSSRPILANCLLEVVESSLTILATDLDISAKVKLPITNTGTGKFCINSKNISDILRELPDNEIILKVTENNVLNLICGEIKYSLLISSAEEFPDISFNSPGNSHNLKINGGELSDIIQKTSYAMSSDETRLFLNGIFFQKYNDRLRAVAIDGHRLAMIDKEVSVPDAEYLKTGIIIPRKGINELKKLAEIVESDIEISVNDSFFIANHDDKYWISIRLVSREYPKYQSVIPAKSSFVVNISRNNLLDAVKRIKILSNETTNGVKFTFRKDFVDLSANNDSLGQAFERVKADFDGEEIEVSLNARYVLETLSALDDQDIKLELNNSLSPVVIKSVNSPNYLGIIMPLRL